MVTKRVARRDEGICRFSDARFCSNPAAPSCGVGLGLWKRKYLIRRARIKPE
jgi:hypothetical protein